VLRHLLLSLAFCGEYVADFLGILRGSGHLCVSVEDEWCHFRVLFAFQPWNKSISLGPFFGTVAFPNIILFFARAWSALPARRALRVGNGSLTWHIFGHSFFLRPFSPATVNTSSCVPHGGLLFIFPFLTPRGRDFNFLLSLDERSSVFIDFYKAETRTCLSSFVVGSPTEP